MHAIYEELLPASGAEFATFLQLTHPAASPPLHGENSKRSSEPFCDLVTARGNVLNLYNVVNWLGSSSNHAHMASSVDASEARPDLKLRLVKAHYLHGIVTGMEAIKTLSSLEDKMDRLLISFEDAKIALLEWSHNTQEFVTVSIHTYERAPQMVALDSLLFTARLRIDPLSRCAALGLPRDSLAILPFYRSTEEIEGLDQQDNHVHRDIPYSPSFILDLAKAVDSKIRNVVDFVLLPGFNKPTIAVLWQTEMTWPGRLKEFKDTCCLTIFALDVTAQTYPVISSVDSLPFDSCSVAACPESIGGVIIMTSNSVLHVDVSGRTVGVAVNGWATQVSDFSYPNAGEVQEEIKLEGSCIAFQDDRTLLVILSDGTVKMVEIVLNEGAKAVGKLVFSSLPTPTGSVDCRTVVPSIARSFRLSDDSSNAIIFVGSVAGPSALLNVVNESIEVEIEDADMTNGATSSHDVVMDDEDEEIYGAPMEVSTSNAVTSKRATRTVRQIKPDVLDYLPAYGSISDMTFVLGYNGDRPIAELVAATGRGNAGGFTIFQKDLPTRSKRKLHVIGGTRGLWSLQVRGKKTNELETVVVSTDVNPSPGLSRIVSRSSKAGPGGMTDITIPTRMPGTTVGAGTMFNQTAIVQVLTGSIRVVEADGTERQAMKDMDGTTPRSRIKSCSVVDPYVLIIREDETMGLFVELESGGKLRRKDMSALGDKNTSRYLSAHLFRDESGLLDRAFRSTIALQEPDSGGKPKTWLMLVRPGGALEIWTLPKLTLAFSTTAFSVLESAIPDSRGPPANSSSTNPIGPQEGDIDQICVSLVGERHRELHLFTLLRSGSLAVYRAVAVNPPTSPSPEDAPVAGRAGYLDIQFVKVLQQNFSTVDDTSATSSTSTGRPGILAEQKKVVRTFVSFKTIVPIGTTSATPLKGAETTVEQTQELAGVFFTGDNSCWFLGTDKGGLNAYKTPWSTVSAFTPSDLLATGSNVGREFLVYSEEGPALVELMPSYSLCYPGPSSGFVARNVPRGRSYANLVYDQKTGLVIASSVLQARFASYTEDIDSDPTRVWEPDTPGVEDPKTDTSAIELIDLGDEQEPMLTMDGFEFALNEFVNDITIVELETNGTTTGRKEFVAVGTSINRGEDLAVKGAVYIFEIVEVVSPDPARRWFRLRLRCKDDAKGPVTALCGFSGYLVSSMGQKIFVRAFDSDERLVGVAFLDVGVYVTSLRSMKNLLLVGDAVKSVMFVAFQEDPYKLVILSKDVQPMPQVNISEFFFNETEMNILVCDEKGIMRLFEYNPQDPDSNDGKHLLLRNEFNTQAEHRAAATIAFRSPQGPTQETREIPQTKILFGSTNGSISLLTPISDSDSGSSDSMTSGGSIVGKRLGLLQGQLTRNFQHTAGLNPKAFRLVRNEYQSRNLSRGILDGTLLSQFGQLSMKRQEEMVKQIGGDRRVILRDLAVLSASPW